MNVDALDLCHFHGYEPVPEKYYKVCGECHHVFLTPEEVLRTEADVCRAGGFKIPVSIEEVFCCPLCTHDF